MQFFSSCHNGIKGYKGTKKLKERMGFITNQEIKKYIRLNRFILVLFNFLKLLKVNNYFNSHYHKIKKPTTSIKEKVLNISPKKAILRWLCNFRRILFLLFGSSIVIA